MYWVNVPLTLYLYLFVASSDECNALFDLFSSEHIAWLQEEAPCGGSFMREAIIFIWTSAPPSAKAQTLDF